MSFITSPGVIVPPLTAGGVAYGTGSQAKINNAGTVGQYLISAGAGVPTFTNLGTFTTVNCTNLVSSGTLASSFTVTSGTAVPLRITNEGTGNSFVVEDSSNPDNTPVVVDANGNFGVGLAPTSAAKTNITSTSAGASTIALSLQNASDTINSETILDFVTNTSGTGVRSAQITAINTTGSTGVNMVFKIANGAPPAEAMRITSLGGLQLTRGLGVSGTTPGTTGVAFPATAVAVADANTLDDYEEGTWTPVVTFSGGNGDLTTAEAVGVYTKIGRLVQIAFNLEFSETTALTNLTITGVPFTSGGVVRTFVGCWVDNMSALVGSPIAGLAVATTTISMQTTGTGGAALITNANTGASSRVRGSLSYSI